MKANICDGCGAILHENAIEYIRDRDLIIHLCADCMDVLAEQYKKDGKKAETTGAMVADVLRELLQNHIKLWADDEEI